MPLSQRFISITVFFIYLLTIIVFNKKKNYQLTQYVALIFILILYKLRTKLLLFRSFIVTGQPDAVLKTGHKIGKELRLLIAESLGIQPQLDLARITVKIIYEKTAQQLMAGTARLADVYVL